MKSTYLDNIRNKCQSERDTLLGNENADFSKTIDDLKRRLSVAEKAYIDKFLIGALVFGVLIGAAVAVFLGWLGFVLGALLGVGLNSALMNGWKAGDVESSKKIQKLIDEREKKNKKLCDKYRSDCSEKIKKEEDNYNNKVSEAIKIYASSTVMDPIVKWLSDGLQAKILEANKERYTKYIEASIAYRVEEKCIELLEIMPHSNGYSTVNNYNFYENTFNDVTDFFKRIGLAKVLSKRVELEIKTRVLNGVIKEEFSDSTTITIQSDDNFVRMDYQTLNPNYKAPVEIEHH